MSSVAGNPLYKASFKKFRVHKTLNVRTFSRKMSVISSHKFLALVKLDCLFKEKEKNNQVFFCYEFEIVYITFRPKVLVYS